MVKTMVWDSLKSAKHDKTIWLDVANAYGSVPHRLIYFALKRYGVSEKWIKIIQQYYGGIWSTLTELIFAGTKFRSFWGHPRNLIPAKRKNLTIREI